MSEHASEVDKRVSPWSSWASVPPFPIVPVGSPVGWRQYYFAGSVILALVLGGAIATPYAGVKLYAMPGYMAMFGAAMVVINVLLASLLFSKGVIEGRGNAIRLGAAYLFVCIIFIPLTASFPDSLIPGQLIGTTISPVWLWSFWHAGFGLAIIRYGWFAGRSPSANSRLIPNIAGVLAAVVIATFTATNLLEYMPTVAIAGTTLFVGGTKLWLFIVMVISVMALVSVARLGARTPEQLWLTVGMVATCFDVWLTYQGSVRYSAGWYLSKGGSLLTSVGVLTSLFHEVTQLYGRAFAHNAVLSELVSKDGLTRLANRRCFDETLEIEWRRARREKQPLSLLMIDVDHFKAFNDIYGHQSGDDCLQRVAAMLQRGAKRPADLVARYGGEEFVMLLPNTYPADAAVVAENVRSSIGAMILPNINSVHGFVTVSIGVATAIPDQNDDPSDVIGAADVRLYAAKSAGRNRVVGDAPEGLAQSLDVTRTGNGVLTQSH